MISLDRATTCRRRRGADLRQLGRYPQRQRLRPLVDRTDGGDRASGPRQEVPGARVIGFPKGAGLRLERYARETGVDAVGIDWTVPIDYAREQLQPRVAVQGNLDPIVLLAGGEALDQAIDGSDGRSGRRPFHLQSRPWNPARDARSPMSNGWLRAYAVRTDAGGEAGPNRPHLSGAGDSGGDLRRRSWSGARRGSTCGSRRSTSSR